jgi:hypothetical protein
MQPASIPVGNRNTQLFKLASKLRYADVPYEEALKTVVLAASDCSFSIRESINLVDSAYGRWL